jgi:hypothetical protein
MPGSGHSPASRHYPKTRQRLHCCTGVVRRSSDPSRDHRRPHSPHRLNRGARRDPRLRGRLVVRYAGSLGAVWVPGFGERVQRDTESSCGFLWLVGGDGVVEHDIGRSRGQ